MSITEQNSDNDLEVNPPKPFSKYRKDDEPGFKLNLNLNPKKSVPYLLVVFIFIMSLYLVFLLFDGIIMPAFVHNKDIVKVPDLTGKSIDEGSRILVNNHLAFKIAQEIYSEEYPPQTIVKQVPYIGMEVKEGRTIYLTVSKGKETVSVPYIINLTLNQARFELRKRGLEIGDIEYDFSDYIGRDSIMNQGVKAGSFLPYGSTVTITISQGSNSQMPIPALVGLKFEDIDAILSETGFILGNINYQSSETFTPNTIISQNPAQGELYITGTKIDITVSK